MSLSDGQLPKAGPDHLLHTGRSGHQRLEPQHHPLVYSIERLIAQASSTLYILKEHDMMISSSLQHFPHVPLEAANQSEQERHFLAHIHPRGRHTRFFLSLISRLPCGSSPYEINSQDLEKCKQVLVSHF